VTARASTAGKVKITSKPPSAALPIDLLRQELRAGLEGAV